MPQKMITAAFGLAYDGRGKYLLTLRRDPEDPTADGQWQIPGGGVEFGEPVEKAMIRELQEEIKCTPTILEERPTVCVSVWPAKSGQEIDYHITLITYLVSIGDQIPEKTEESADCVWYTVEEVMKLDTLPNVKENVQSLSQLVK